MNLEPTISMACVAQLGFVIIGCTVVVKGVNKWLHDKQNKIDRMLASN